MNKTRIVVLAGMLGLLVGCRQGSAPVVKLAPARVEYMTPVNGIVTDFAEFPGQTDARITVQVRSRVSGYITKVYFKDGSQVEENNLLFEVDPRPYKADFDRAKGNLEQIVAHKKRLEHEYQRAKSLYASRSISLEDYERYETDLRETEANIEVAKANLEVARLDLEWTEIRAPSTGLLSRRLVDPGNLIKADDTILTSIVTQDPMYVYFDVDEQNTLHVRRLIREGQVKARSEKEVPVLVGLSDETPAFPHEGTVDFTDNRVDVNSGTLRFRATVANPKGVLTPGLFARVRLPIGDPHSTLFVREEAIASDQGRKIVYVIEPADEKTEPKADGAKPATGELGGKIETREVKVGSLRDGYRAIESGLNPGDRIVVTGLQRIRPGINVIATALKSGSKAPKDIAFRATGSVHQPGGGSPEATTRTASP